MKNLYVIGCVTYVTAKLIGAGVNACIAYGEFKALHQFGKDVKTVANGFKEKES